MTGKHAQTKCSDAMDWSTLSAAVRVDIAGAILQRMLLRIASLSESCEANRVSMVLAFQSICAVGLVTSMRTMPHCILEPQHSGEAVFGDIRNLNV